MAFPWRRSLEWTGDTVEEAAAAEESVTTVDEAPADFAVEKAAYAAHLELGTAHTGVRHGHPESGPIAL